MKQVCTYLDTCPFFNDTLANMPAMSEVLKTQFCRASFKECARFVVREALGKEAVPITLFPNQREKAEELLNRR